MGERHSIELRPQQVALWNDFQRFSVLVLHRRFGKTVLALCKLIHDVQECQHPMPRGHYFAPYLKQAKAIAWDYLQLLTAPMPGMKYNKSELTATFPAGQRIQLFGADNPDAFRGQYSDTAVMDEVAQMSPRIWGEVLRPALADREGKCLFIGTPFGQQNLFYELYDKADERGWFKSLQSAYDTGIIPAPELEQLRLEMSEWEFEQEMLCSWVAQIRGAFWGQALREADEANRIGDHVMFDPALPVSTAWDLGMNDSTAIWFVQGLGNEVRLIDYAEYQGTGLPDIIADLRKKPYQFDAHIAPHDIRVRELGSGVSRWETARSLGVNFEVAKNIPVMDGIEAVRQMLPRVWVNAKACKYGLEALRMYRQDYADDKRVYSLKPVHDWTSHAADALRYYAVRTGGGRRRAFQGELDYSAHDRSIV